MTERVEKKATIIEQKIWSSEDGEEFYDKRQCFEYEQKLVWKRADQIAKALAHFCFTPDYVDCDTGWEWYFVKNQDEFDAVMTVLYDSDSSAHDYIPAEFPCWLAFSVNENGYGSVEGTPEEVFGKMERFKQETLEELKKADENEKNRG